MTRKRFIKLLMAKGSTRNDANRYTIAAQITGKSYETAYQEFMRDLSNTKKIIENANIALQKVADMAYRLGIAISKAISAFNEAYYTGM